MDQLETLKELGFDLSRRDEDGPSISVRCSQCEALVINGVPCHERRCPNEPRLRNEDAYDVE